MRKLTSAVAAALSLWGAVSCSGTRMNGISAETLEEGFRSIPDSMLTSVYWYWISDHISKEGIIKDLEAMKAVGINRAFIGNIGMGDAEAGVGEVRFDTEAWWDAMHTALKTASQLGIEIGVFNSPGWSQSGGPWVRPEQAMRYLASTAVRVTGGGTVDVELPRPESEYKAHFQDVKVLAFPVPGGGEKVLNRENCSVKVIPEAPHAERMLDGDRTTRTAFPLPAEGGDITVDFTAREPFTLRSVRIFASAAPVDCPARIEVLQDGNYRTLAEFQLARFNDMLSTGFDPHAPVVVCVPATTARKFRLVLTGAQAGCGLREVELSAVPLVERYPEKTLAKMYQRPLPYWHEYMWRDQPGADDSLLAVDPAQVADLSECLCGDRLVWEAPAGEWTVVRTGMLPTGTKNAPARPEATGLEIDKMSRDHVRAHFDAYLGRLLDRIPADDRTTFKVVVQDSYETGGQNFTDDFLASFERRYGYSAVPFLPVYQGTVVGSEDISDRFLWDMRRFVADRVAHDYVGGLRDASHEHGLHTWLECYGHWGFPGEFLQYGGASDEIGGEFWSAGTLGDIENRAASSCGHIYGKTRISAESFTSGDGGYHRCPADYKQRADRFFCEGINSTLLHLYIHQPYDRRDPGINAWFGNEFNRKNTWFPHMDLFVKYLKRVNFMLQQGLNVADAAYFIGEDAPKMTGVTDPALPAGYQFDYINAEVLLRDAGVKNGRLILPHGTQYRVLVLPPQTTMRPEVLERIAGFVRQGLTVVGPRPRRSPSYEGYPLCDEQVRRLAEELWGGIDSEDGYAKVGRGLLTDGKDLAATLDRIGCMPDCRIEGADSVLYAHRDLGGTQLYFLSNQSAFPAIFDAWFRVEGLCPELWNPVDGSVRLLPSFRETEAGCQVPLKLERYESAFVVFRSKAAAPGLQPDVRRNYPAPQTVAELDSGWTAVFDPARRGPAEPVAMDRLTDLTDLPDFDLRHYSGTVRYCNTFELAPPPAAGRLYIDLGPLSAMAKVKINGQSAGGVWTPPWRVEITPWVRQGRNDVEVEVTTTWKNRLIGDLLLPEEQRTTWLTHQPWRADSPLQSSGLLGPVRVESVVY